MGNPVLSGWVSSAGDPCGEAWQGVQCNDTLIQEMYVVTFSGLIISIISYKINDR